MSDNTPEPGDTAPAQRTVNYGRYVLRHPWPADCHVQGGSGGLVIRRDGGVYGTAFVEAFPSDPDTFIRGEGETLTDAEDAAWAKYERVSRTDHEHTFEARGYRNGAGLCSVCDLFQSHIFTPEQVGCFCAVCGTPTFWERVGDVMYCKDHTPDRSERIRMRAEARGRGEHVSALEEFVDILADRVADAGSATEDD